MDTKECRHCKQPIHKDARRCHHCQSAQSWMADQKDPRYLWFALAVIIGLLAIFIGLANKMPDFVSGQESGTPELSVSDIQFVFGTGTNSDRIFVMGELSHVDGPGAARIVLRVNLFNQEGALIDSFLDEPRDLVVPHREKARFRVQTITPMAPSDVAKAEVIVERSRSRGRFD
jgi:hypothetical protein